LCQEAAELPDQGSHGTLRGAHGELHVRSALTDLASAASRLFFFLAVTVSPKVLNFTGFLVEKAL
jgi:hypothetical protein